MSEYKRNPRGARRARKSMSRKAMVIVSLMMVLAMAAVGGTFAWLAASTTTVQNTFTVGDIDIDLYEHLRNEDGTLKTTDADITRTGIDDYKIIPGVDLNKDPTVVVKAGSEACWVFIKVDASNWPTNEKISYSIDTSVWKKLDGVDGVWYLSQDALLSDDDTDATHNVLTGKKIYVNGSLTKSEVNAIQNSLTNNSFDLKITAYAIQKATFDTPDAAWTEIASIIANDGFDENGANE